MRRFAILFAVFALASAIMLPGCSRYASPYDIAFSPSLQSATYKAADELAKQSGGAASGGTIAVATVSDVSNIETSSALGRMITEQLGARFVQLGYTVSEIKLRNDINVRQSDDGSANGEYVLSRDRAQLAAKTNARSVVSGTYAVGADSVFVNLRLIDVNTSRVSAAYDYTLPLTSDVRRMVQSNGASGLGPIFSGGWAE